ncbi:MAG: hypothetical protein ACFE0I_07960 [Elainellaceae cyanobacterium]
MNISQTALRHREQSNSWYANQICGSNLRLAAVDAHRQNPDHTADYFSEAGF